MKKIDGIELIDRDYEILKILEKKSGYKPTYSDALSDYMDIGFFAHKHKVKGLVITQYTFENVPKEIFQLIDLDTLAFFGIKNVDLNNIENLSSLEFLTIRSCGNVHIPDSIGKLNKLIELEVSYSNLRSIPESIGDLNSLEILDLEENNLIELPESIGYLPNLKEIKLGGNPLKSIPKSLQRLMINTSPNDNNLNKY